MAKKGKKKRRRGGNPVRPSGYTAFTTKYGGIVNRIINDIGVSQPFDPNKTAPEDYPKILQTPALWDTGATASFVTPKTVSDLSLISTGETDVHHAGGKSREKKYLANLYLPNNVLLYGVMVTESTKIIGDFGVIIGMDVIARGDFSVSNFRQKTWVTFRIPSYATTDFVAEAKKIKATKGKKKR